VPHMPAAERRDALIDAALRVVADRGIAAATTRAIVAEAGMSLASFHYAFDSRDELLTELVRAVAAQEEVAVLPGPHEGTVLRDVVRAGLERYAEHLRQNPQREQAMLELTWFALRAGRAEDLARNQYEHYYALASAALQLAAEQTGAEWTRPVGEVARILVALTDGLTISWLVDHDDAAAASVMDFAADAVARLAMTRTDAA
jgi:AcrR family transcriptional regulator